MGSAFHHAPRNVLTRLPDVEAELRRRDPWVARRSAAGVHRRFAMRGLVEVCGPLPDIAGHVEQAVAIRREGPDRRGALVLVQEQVLPWEIALPGVRHHAVARRELV